MQCDPGLSALGRALWRHRRTRGWTQAELADRAGISVASISNLERGVAHHPRPETLILLIEAFDLRPEEQAVLTTLADSARWRSRAAFENSILPSS